MKLIIAATIVALGLAAGGFLAGGRYTMIPTTNNAVTRLDRYTGDVSMCIPGVNKGGGCGYVLDPNSK